MQGTFILERTSKFILEVLPYVLSALIAAVIVPGFLYSQAYGTKAAVTPNLPSRGANALEMIRQDHVASAPDRMLLDRSAKTAGDKPAHR